MVAPIRAILPHGPRESFRRTDDGGHLKAVAWPTLEVFVRESEIPLHTRDDEETTLELFDLAT
jgi:predicted DNA-binding protein with PD1-like motif